MSLGKECGFIHRKEPKENPRQKGETDNGKLCFLSRKDRETHCLHQVSVGYLSCEGTKALGRVVCQLKVAHLEL